MSAIARIAASTGYSPQDALTWNGTSWVSVPAGGTATFRLGLLFTATGSSVTPGGTAQFTLSLSFIATGSASAAVITPDPTPSPPSTPPTLDGTVWLYTPPQWILVSQVMGALCSKVPVSTLVYRMNGTWVNQMGAYMDNPVIKNVDVDAATGLLLYFDRPRVVPGTLYNELLALAPADPTWTQGTLVQL